MSDQSIKTWPGAKPRRICPWDIHQELENLVMASSDDEEQEEDTEVDRDDPKAPDLWRRNFHPHEGWRRKGTREMKRERRPKSEGAPRRAETG
jgi:hypothetical protein